MEGKTEFAKQKSVYLVIKEFGPNIIHTHHVSIRYCFLSYLLYHHCKKFHTIHVDAYLEAGYLGQKMQYFVNISNKIPSKYGNKVRRISERLLCNAKNSSYTRLYIKENSKVYKKQNIEDFMNCAIAGAKFLNYMFRHCSVHPIAVSKFVSDTCAELYDLEQISLIYTGIDSAKRYVANQNSEGPMKIIHVGRFDEGKNHELLIQAFAKVHEVFPDVLLTLLGDGEYRGKVLKQIARLGILDQVTYLGIRSDVMEIMRKCQIFALSSMTEGFGIVLLEAMATGNAVVTTNVGGIPEIIEDGENGLLVEANDSDKYATALLRLICDETLRKRLVEHSKKTVEKFQIQKTVEQYESIYKKVNMI